MRDDVKRAGGGRGGIRTHGRLAPTPVFKTGALNRSATLPIAALWRKGRLIGKSATRFQRELITARERRLPV